MKHVTAETTTRSRWAGVPAVERQAERRALLLDAGLEALGTEGWAATTVRGICQAARLNPRYFYESFDDLDQLLVAVYDRLVADLGRAVLEAVAPVVGDPTAEVRSTIETIVRFLTEDPRRARVLYIEALGNEALARRRMETVHSLVELVERSTYERYGAPPPGERIGSVAAAILVGGMGELLLAWFDGRLDIGREQLIDDATALLVAIGEAAGSIAAARSGR